MAHDLSAVPKWEVKDRTNGEAELDVALPYLQHITERTVNGEKGYALAATRSYTPDERLTLLASLVSFHRSVGLLLEGVVGMCVEDKMKEELVTD